MLFFIWLAKVLVFLARITKKGSGTSLPGLLLETKFSSLLPTLAKGFSQIIFISGTNGKTTTRAMLAHIYRENGVKVCTNSGGANLVRGISSSLLSNRNLLGRIKSKVGIFEIEEASLPILTKFIQPNKLILTNVFRDQLDAYGEIDKTLGYFKEALENITVSDFQLFLNADDYKLLSILENTKITAIGFGLKLEEALKPKFEALEGPKTKKLTETVLAKNIQTQNLETAFKIKYEKKDIQIKSKLPGSYNIYNILASFLVSYKEFGQKSLASIANFEPVFGRGEKITLKESSATIFLVKNPAGFDQVLSLIASNFADKKINLVVAINDNIADGKDVSWLWDVSLEGFMKTQKLKSLITSGTRGLDMLLRFEYTKLEVSEENYFKNLADVVEILEREPDDYIILATYTAMREFRQLMGQKVVLKDINSEGY